MVANIRMHSLHVTIRVVSPQSVMLTLLYSDATLHAGRPVNAACFETNDAPVIGSRVLRLVSHFIAMKCVSSGLRGLCLRFQISASMELPQASTKDRADSAVDIALLAERAVSALAVLVADDCPLFDRREHPVVGCEHAAVVARSATVEHSHAPNDEVFARF